MLNIVAITGRLVASPELRSTHSGTPITNISVACERNYSSPEIGRETDFFDVVLWGKTAEFVCKFFKKGSMIAINGSLQTRTYEDKSGVKRKVFEIKADGVNFCGDKRDNPTTPTSKEDFDLIDDSEDLPF